MEGAPSSTGSRNPPRARHIASLSSCGSMEGRDARRWPTVRWRRSGPSVLRPTRLASTAIHTHGTKWRICSSWNLLPVLATHIPIPPLTQTHLATLELRFPQYKSREFYILGESYAGHYVPQLAKLVHDGNKAASKTIINLKGFMVGNAVTDWYYDNLGIVDYYWTHALISDETYTTMKRHCKFTSVELSSECQRIMDYASNQEIGNVDLHSIYTPVCLEATWSSSTGRKSSRTAPHWNPLWMGQTGFDPCTPSYAEKYFNRPDVQRALHANGTPNNVPHPWTPCNYGILENWHDKAFSVLPIYKELIKAGLRIWVYSGDEDAMVPVTGTRYWIRSLKLPIVNRWYPWYYMDQVAGWSQTYKGLTFATVRGAGHEVPVLQPDRSLSLLEHYLRGKPLPKR
ncbi:serine carboxypeptidase II-1 isoform X3 [Selaginella moellendorffii]|uniref:serine carboxypeptidase II-1 isoform X3 n=1 Tax=Selaginella moellendorffii TaxID=88036 RepID=UPI000D1CFA91|nr:serine carboxypeptidase II-1 isoform X3 [Selaginella moellendorffii]|eukprot:XP_024518303.1 serine carboxypeptidase II-1 isoform X3 [Selaginella moellendorffii]